MSIDDNEGRLQDILEYSRYALQFAQDKSRQDFDDDRMLVFAIIRAVEVVGEAASKLTKEFRE